MATYTSAQLYGYTIGENLSGTKTFAFTNSDNSTGYFVLEAVRDANGFYNASSAVVSAGTFNISSSMLPGFITSSNVFALVIPPGNSSFTFTPTSTITGTSYYLRGAGNFTLTIS